MSTNGKMRITNESIQKWDPSGWRRDTGIPMMPEGGMTLTEIADWAEVSPDSRIWILLRPEVLGVMAASLVSDWVYDAVITAHNIDAAHYERDHILSDAKAAVNVLAYGSLSTAAYYCRLVATKIATVGEINYYKAKVEGALHEAAAERQLAEIRKWTVFLAKSR